MEWKRCSESSPVGTCVLAQVLMSLFMPRQTKRVLMRRLVESIAGCKRLRITSKMCNCQFNGYDIADSPTPPSRSLDHFDYITDDMCVRTDKHSLDDAFRPPYSDTGPISVLMHELGVLWRSLCHLANMRREFATLLHTNTYVYTLI